MTSDNKETIGNFQVEDGKLKTRREVLLMGALAAGGLMATSAAQAATESPIKEAAATAGAGGASAGGGKVVAAKDFSHLVTKNMPGLSAKQIEPHLKLYQGYVSKTNEIQNALNTVDIKAPPPNATYHPLRELLVEQSFALNGVIYHELYFGNLGGSGGDPTGDLRNAVEDRWGSTGKFNDLLVASGKCMRGWVIIGWNTRDGSLQDYGLDMHNMWVPANIVPIVVLDVYEHAYMIDYGIDRGKYLEAFMKNVDWDVCGRRFAAARKHPAGPDSTV
jgi:superoxide dismutase, Fe-Mn family